MLNDLSDDEKISLIKDLARSREISSIILPSLVRSIFNLDERLDILRNQDVVDLFNCRDMHKLDDLINETLNEILKANMQYLKVLK